jgi:DNA-directed RNA polymerase subunit beta'
MKKNQKEIFSSIEEIEQAVENKSISLHSKIVSIFKTTDQDGKPIDEKYTSTAGRFLLANVLPKNHNINFL